MNQKKLHLYQLKKAQSIVNYAYNNSKYFRKHYYGFELNDVWKLPVTNKKLMMQNLSDYNTVGFDKEELNLF